MIRTYVYFFILLFSQSVLATDDKVRLQLKWQHSFAFAGYYAAELLGFYRDAGLDVELIEGAPNTNVYSEVATGKADYGVGNSSLLVERSRGRPFVILAVVFQHSPMIFVTQDTLLSFNDWLGKRVMLEGSSDELILYLEQEGVKLYDLEFLRHSFDPKDLVNKRVDVMSANSTVEPYFLAQQNFPYRVFSPRSAGIDFSGDNLFTSEEEIKYHPDRVAAFRDASLKGWDYALKHPDIVIDWIISVYRSSHDRDYLEFEAKETYDLIQPSLIEVGYLNESRWLEVAKAYQKNGKLNAGFDVGAVLYHPVVVKDWREVIILLVIAGCAVLLLVSIILFVVRTNKRLDAALKESHQARHLVAKQANQDPLTELHNRRFFKQQLNTLALFAEQEGKAFALLYLDLDRFKEVNDLYGHQWGDYLLREVAKRLQKCIPKGAELARIGGDEFTILVPYKYGQCKLAELAKTILAELEQPYSLYQNEIFISASIGITQAPLDSTEPSALLQYADEAMYAAKSAGRSRWCFFSFELHQQAIERQSISNDLRQALSNNELFLVFQPIVDMQTGHIRKFETLLRWQHPNRGLIPPEAFIPIAEESGLIAEIGDYVFKESIRQLADWRRRFAMDLMMSINISPYQLSNPEKYMSDWFEFLHDQHVPGYAVSLEITENMLMHHTEAVSKQLLAFRDEGINVALDDFGTGYSALSYLNRLDIDYIKIDRSFVSELTEEHMEKDLCEAIISMAHKLKLKVVAEGIETQAQAAILIKFGCDLGQGYLYSKPLLAQDAEALLMAQQV